MLTRLLHPLRRAVQPAVNRSLLQVLLQQCRALNASPSMIMLILLSMRLSHALLLQPLRASPFSSAGDVYPVRLALANENFKCLPPNRNACFPHPRCLQVQQRALHHFL